jgi:hypothetical protein
MGAGFARHRLVHRINEAFGADNIATTADSIAALPGAPDTFDILHSQGLFDFPPDFELDRYRRSLPIPELNSQIMTLAFQTAVQQKIPLSFCIIEGESEQIQVTVSPARIMVVLVRTD